MQALVQIKNALAHTLTQEEQQLVTAVSGVAILAIIVCRGMSKTARAGVAVGRWMFVAKPVEIKPLSANAETAIAMLKTLHAVRENHETIKAGPLVVCLAPDALPSQRVTLHGKDLSRSLELHEIDAVLKAAEARWQAEASAEADRNRLEDLYQMQAAMNVGRDQRPILSVEQMADRRAAAERALNASPAMRHVLNECKNGEGK